MEILWLIITLANVVFGVHQSVVQGIRIGYVFFIFAIVSFLMYILRRIMRKSKKSDKENE